MYTAFPLSGQLSIKFSLFKSFALVLLLLWLFHCFWFLADLFWSVHVVFFLIVYLALKFNRFLNLLNFRSLYNVQYPFSFGKLLFTISSIAASDSKWHNNNCLLICLEKAMSPHSSTFAWKIPWTEEPGRLQSMGSLESDTTEWLHFHFSLSCIGEGNGNPLQCSCLENPRDGGAW